MIDFYPEGRLTDNFENKNYLSCFANLLDAYDNQIILEAKAIVCDSKHNLIVEPEMAATAIAVVFILRLCGLSAYRRASADKRAVEIITDRVYNYVAVFVKRGTAHIHIGGIGDFRKLFFER